MTFQVMCALRVYIRQGDNAPGKGLLKGWFRKPLSQYLIQGALKAGVTHASLHVGQVGFANGAKVVSMELSDIPATSLPVCVEFVAPKQLLEQFVHDQAEHLANATLVMLEGVHVRPQIVEDDSPAAHPHHIEYIKAGSRNLAVDHVEVGRDLPEKPLKIVSE